MGRNWQRCERKDWEVTVKITGTVQVFIERDITPRRRFLRPTHLHSIPISAFQADNCSLSSYRLSEIRHPLWITAHG
jgi:hypothetical protein